MDAQNSSSHRSCRVLVVVAGTNEPSNSSALADAFTEGLTSEWKVEVSKVRLKDLSIHHFTLKDYEPGGAPTDDMAPLLTKMQEACAVIIASPVWNFSVPAHLKNFIDRLGVIGLDRETRSKGQFKGKPFYIIYTGGAPFTAWKTLMRLTLLHMNESIKYFGGVAYGRYYEPRCMVGEGKFGYVMDKRPESLAKVREKGRKFSKVARRYAETGTLPFFTTIKFRFFRLFYGLGNRVLQVMG